MLSAVGPRPIAFASTISREGEVNLSPFSFFNLFSTNPPMAIFSPSRRGRDGSFKDTHLNVLEVPEVVLNMVNYDMVQQMSVTSNEFPKGINEFLKAGLTMVPSQAITPPRVAESPVAFECRVQKVIELGDIGAAGNLVLCKIEYMHVRENLLDNDGNLDTTQTDLVGRMGGNWYCRASGEALFEVIKPSRKLAIGFDQLPKHLLESDVLTGNELGILASSNEWPSKQEIETFKQEKFYPEFGESQLLGKALRRKIHDHIKSKIRENNAREALILSLCAHEIL